MTGPHPRTVLVIAELRKLAAEGKSMGQADEQVSLSRSRVDALAKRHGIEFRDARRSSGSETIEAIKRLAKSGASRNEVAQKLSLSYQYVVRVSLDHGIEFAPKASDRNSEIARRYLAGEEQAALAREYGITRERVRQICDKQGCVPARKRHEDFVATVAGAVVRKGLTLDDAAAMFRISRGDVYLYCKKHGVKAARLSDDDAEALDALILAATTKTSIRQAAKCDRTLANKVARHLKKRGLKSKGRSRWDSFEDRKRLVTQWRADGLTWAQCAEKLSEHDGKPIGMSGLYLWVCKHLAHLIPKRTAA